jgi:hypothetical protein
MDRENIIKLAREAGCKPFRSPEHWDDVQVFATPNVLERFAALVAAHEREACAKICADIAMHREMDSYGMLVAHSCANEILARGEKLT